jgi:hypothetical protein
MSLFYFKIKNGLTLTLLSLLLSRFVRKFFVYKYTLSLFFS